MTGRSGKASFTPIVAAAAEAEIALGIIAADELSNTRRRRERLLDDHGVPGQHLSDRVQKREGLHRRRARKRAGLRLERFALGGDRGTCAPEPFARRATGTARHALADGGRDLGQRRLHVAEDGDGRRIVLAELPWIDVEMNELDIRRHRIDVGGERQREQIASD
jgi:hypothetical protein